VFEIAEIKWIIEEAQTAVGDMRNALFTHGMSHALLACSERCRRSKAILGWATPMAWRLGGRYGRSFASWDLDVQSSRLDVVDGFDLRERCAVAKELVVD
jgi:hypothetical protein